MYVSDWVPPGTDGEAPAEARDGGVGRPLVAVVALVAAAVLGVLACDYALTLMECTAGLAGGSC